MNLRAISGRPTFRLALALFLLAFFTRLGILLILRPYEQPLRVEIHRLAYSIASGNGYGNPYATPTGPTALYSPGVPFILAALYRSFGTGTPAEAATQVLDIAVVSLVYALLPFIAYYIGMPSSAGVLAAVAGTVVPVYLLNEFRSTTAVFNAVCLELLCLLTAYAWRSRLRPTPGLGVVFGAAWGGHSSSARMSSQPDSFGLYWLRPAMAAKLSASQSHSLRSHW